MSDNPYEAPQDYKLPGDYRALQNAAAQEQPLGFKDRTAGLVLFGVLEILIGGFSALMIPMMAVSAMMPQSAMGASGVRMMIPAMIVYAVVAVAFIWLGIGSIMARRWARALMLIVSWLWLVCGSLGIVYMLVLMPTMWSQMWQNGNVPVGAIIAVVLITAGMMGCLYVFLPVAFLLFYRSKHVKATCEFKDPHVRWTDKCPLPVLALSLMLGFSTLSMLSMFAYCVVPVFGIFLSGAPAAFILLVVMVLLAYLARATYQLKPHAWWGTIALVAVWGLSTIVTFLRVGLMGFYVKMDLPEQQMAMMQQMAAAQSIFMTWGTGIMVAVFVGYMLYLKRYFVSPAA